MLLAAGPSLKEVVISGSRNEQASDELPMSIDVITARDIESGQMRDIRDVAKDIPNVSVKRAPARFSLAGSNAGRDGNAGFNIRGLEGNRVLLLVDGVRAPRSYVFGATAFGRDYFSLDLLKRIEIVRGPASVLYGSDGLAGLVNFITHVPADFLEGGKSLGGRVSSSYSGDNQGLNLSGTLAGRASDTVEWLLSATKGRAKELDNLGANGAFNADRTRPNLQTDTSSGVLGKVVIKPSAAQKHVLGFEYIEKKSVYDLLTSRSKPPLVATSVLRSDSSTTADRTRLSWNALYNTNALLADKLQTMVSYQKAGTRQVVYDTRNGAADRERNTTYDESIVQLGMQADKTMRISPEWSQKLTYGYDYTQAKISNLQTGLVPPAGEVFPLKRFPDTTESSSAFYLQDEFVSNALSITPGVRVDQFKLNASQTLFPIPAASLSGSAVSPKLGVLFRATPQWSVFGNYASGFRAPNASQLNGFFENVTSFYKTVSNPKLKPEKSQNLELGVRGRLNAFNFDMAAFTGKYKDLIEDNATVGGAGVVGNPTIFQSVNRTSATISGFEVKGVMDWGQLAGGQITTPFAYGKTRGTDNTTGRPLDSIDPAKLVVGLKYATTDWDLRLSATSHSAKDLSDIGTKTFGTPAVQQFTVAAATTFDVNGQWRINKKMRVNGGVTNLTNQKYWNWSDVRGLSASSNVVDAYTQPGRKVNVSLVLDF